MTLHIVAYYFAAAIFAVISIFMIFLSKRIADIFFRVSLRQFAAAAFSLQFFFFFFFSLPPAPRFHAAAAPPLFAFAAITQAVFARLLSCSFQPADIACCCRFDTLPLLAAAVVPLRHCRQLPFAATAGCRLPRLPFSH